MIICPNCLTKDFCECVKATLRKERRQRRDAAVSAVENALRKHRITYSQSGVPHVVVIVQPDTPEIYLSLKSQRDGWGCTLYKYRFAGTSEWHTTRRDDFFDWLKHPSLPEEFMPHGKFKGKALTELLVTSRWHLEWWYKQETAPARLRYTLALLLGKDILPLHISGSSAF